jgi:hypothetical protein
VKYKIWHNFRKNLTKLVKFTLEKETFPPIPPSLNPKATNLKHSLGKEKNKLHYGIIGKTRWNQSLHYVCNAMAAW